MQYILVNKHQSYKLRHLCNMLQFSLSCTKRPVSSSWSSVSECIGNMALLPKGSFGSGSSGLVSHSKSALLIFLSIYLRSLQRSLRNQI